MLIVRKSLSLSVISHADKKHNQQHCVSVLRHIVLYFFNQKYWYEPILFCILSHSTVIHTLYTFNTFIRRKKNELCKAIITPVQSKTQFWNTAMEGGKRLLKKSHCVENHNQKNTMPEASVVHSWIYCYNTVLYLVILTEYKYIFYFIHYRSYDTSTF